MQQWGGEVSEEQLEPEDLLIRECVMGLIEDGRCDANVAVTVVRELVTGLKSL
ncbi:hypothetical protein [Mycobacterium sp. 155]|uniref:hypothetical protein n=1 Tax=Mycobacterium sp. 155 TaxID=1157943 RepID=UPI000382EE5B|nr:hypothetical protein [Mycobacterium sp. 155]